MICVTLLRGGEGGCCDPSKHNSGYASNIILQNISTDAWASWSVVKKLRILRTKFLCCQMHVIHVIMKR